MTNHTHTTKPQNTSDWICPECESTKTQYSLKIIPTGKSDPRLPRFVPQVKEACQKCGRYRRFAPQGEILIKRFNDRLSSITLPAKGRDFYEG